MKHLSIVVTATTAAFLAGCAINQSVKPVGATAMAEVCIKNNPAVMMADFLKELRSQLEAKGIRTSTFDGERPDRCRHHLEYTANWRWDFAMYMAFADLRVHEDGLLVGQATYDALGGGMNLGKFGSTSEKMKRLVEPLFARQ
jgi:hypothetical protein